MLTFYKIYCYKHLKIEKILLFFSIELNTDLTDILENKLNTLIQTQEKRMKEGIMLHKIKFFIINY